MSGLPLWDRANPAGLLSYLWPDEVGRLLPGLPTTAQGFAGDRYERVAAAYEQIRASAVRYANEPLASQGRAQAIRPPDEVLPPPGWEHAPRRGTCMDLSLVFAAACLHAGLHPVVVVLDPARGGSAHALVVVWLHGDYRGGHPLLDEDPIDGHVHREPLRWSAGLRGPADAAGGWVAVDITRAADGYHGNPATFAEAAHSGTAMINDLLTGGGVWRWGFAVGVGTGYLSTVVHHLSGRPALPPLDPAYSQADATGGPRKALRARQPWVSFVDRPELVQLLGFARSAAASGTTVAVALVEGPGGSGKTRLAAELAHRLGGEGWWTGFLRDTATHAEVDWLAQVVDRLLVVIDYVEALSTEQVARLVRVLSVRSGPSVVLFTARTRGPWWGELTETQDWKQVNPKLFDPVQPLPHSHPEPMRLFNRAYRRFAGRSDAGEQRDPAPPADAKRWTALELLMHAWLAAKVGPATLPDRRTALYDEFLKREYTHWRDTIAARPGVNEPTDLTLKITAQLVALLNPTADQLAQILTQGELLKATGDAPVRVAELLGSLLRERGAPTLALTPDPLADHLIRTADPRLFEVCVDAGAAETALGEHLCTSLTRAGEDEDPGNRAAAAELAQAALTRRPTLWAPAFAEALRRGGAFVAALEHLADQADTPLPLRELNGVIPAGHSALARLAYIAAIRTRATSTEINVDVDPDRAAKVAEALTLLAIRHADVGDREQALAPSQEAVDIRRRLAEANPGAYLPDLAMSLNNLGARLSELGQREQALAPSQEAVDIYRRLAEANPGAYLPNLAGSLNNLGALLSELGQREQALAPSQEAVDIRRRLAEANPGAYLPDLAGSLNNLGARLSELGQREQVPAVFADAWGDLGPGPRAQLRLALNRWRANHAPDAEAEALAEFRAAVADADAEPQPARAASARRAVRSAHTQIHGNDGPPWLVADLPDDVVGVLNALMATPTWAARASILRTPAGDALWQPQGRTARLAVVALYGDQGLLLSILSLLDAIEEHGLESALDNMTAAEAHQALVLGWLAKPTWTASRHYLADHREVMNNPATEAFLVANTDEHVVRQHLALVRLHAMGLSLDEVYDIVVDPTDALDAALLAVEHRDLPRLTEIWHAAPHLSRRAFYAPYLAAVLVAGSDGPDPTEQTTALMRQAASHAAAAEATIDLHAAAARLRRAADRTSAQDLLTTLADLLEATTPHGDAAV